MAPNVLARPCDVAQPHHVWVGEISDVWTAEGWWSVATLLDWSARQVVGWAMRSRIDTALLQDTWRMALGRRQPAAGVLHHADRGSQDARHASQALLAQHGLIWSMRRQGACLDNAVAERCCGSRTREWTTHRAYATRQEARDAILAYMEMFSNSQRPHAYLGYVSPHDYERGARVA